MASGIMPALALGFILIGALYLASGSLPLDCSLPSGLIIGLAASMLSGSIGFVVCGLIVAGQHADDDRGRATLKGGFDNDDTHHRNH
jgi:hypothetical protein